MPHGAPHPGPHSRLPRKTLNKQPAELDSQAADSVPEQKLLPFHTPAPMEILWQCWFFIYGGGN